MRTKELSVFLIFFMIFGKVLLAATLDFDLFNGSGKFINAKGGTITSPDNDPYDDVTGRVYVSGDFGENDYSDSIETHTIFTALKFSGIVSSESPVYNAEIGSDLSTNEYYFVLTRNKFNEGIIKNRELGEILEAGYFDDNNPLKDRFYNGIKNFYSREDLNSAIDETFGVNFYPLVTKQTLEIITDANASVMDTVSTIDEYLLAGNVKALADYKYHRVKVDSADNFNGYETKSSVISFGAETKVNSDLKIGTMCTFIDSTTDMDDYEGSRDDFFYIGRLHMVYDTDSAIFSSMLSAGGSDTDIYRYNFSSLGDFRSDSHLTNFFLGLNNSVYKKFELGRSEVTPRIELNLIGLHQGEIEEDGDYGLEIDEINTLSVKPGVGFSVGRVFNITHRTKLNIEADVMNYIEVGDPYEDLDIKLNTVSPKEGSIEKYDQNSYHLELSLKQGLKSLNGLSFSLVENWSLYENQDRFTFEFELELSYIF
ncbi:hypothetical protein PM10SUCC1_20990 [Propionigenium maris DSM 9537]|uniref:Autotransporter domain-containing protein n=1 Tax=Propionigenium maris DSM 9537 TaxID=1123000 RepID=A0A9W6LP47_9FUSO|nr:autotransporter outer membrane beta-barrel domain-containing protein [Propionigenium maris]GLI56585.1 hypothetical protein PM10SUCC1_20990 [Propionigenium maris DSM 9537]